jgi:hypothetical protein
MPSNTIKILNGNIIGPTTLGSVEKRYFNPKRIEDLLEYKHFITKGRWKNSTCPFRLQWPYLTIPNMLHEVVARHYVTKELKTK